MILGMASPRAAGREERKMRKSMLAIELSVYALAASQLALMLVGFLSR